MMEFSIINANVFTGEAWLESATVHVIEEIIQYVGCGLSPKGNVYDAMGSRLVPGFIDLQVYGAAELLFAEHPTVDALHALAHHNLQNGTTQCLVTLATQPLSIIYKAIDAIAQYWQQGGKGIAGLHIEGPFIHPEKRGAHPIEWIRPIDTTITKALLTAGKGVVKMITLAPELCSPEIIQLWRQAEVIVSAGHSNANYDQANAALDGGVSTVTHLFNAMSGIHHRDIGLAGATMQHNHARASIIADGIHVSYPALQMAKKCMGKRLFYITDAVTTTKTGGYLHQLADNCYRLPNGTLSGSSLTMLQAVKNGVQYAGIDWEESLRMASEYPAAVIGKATIWGKIAPGYVAEFIMLDSEGCVVKTWA